jgi:lipid-A-disaccharide synthase
MKVFLVAGEASGDARGAELMRALHERAPDIKFFGAGGREMRALAGEDFLDWADEAVVGLWDVLKKYGYFKKQFDRTLAHIERVSPAAVILIDYPGFNLRLAKALRARRFAGKIIYYISPQVWAWNRGRIPQMARLLDLMLCIFPFEQPLYEKSGLTTKFVGHPMLDSVAMERTGVARDPKLVGLFPGSREKEVRRLFPVMLEAMHFMSAVEDDLRFEVAAASPQIETLLREIVEDYSWTSLNVGERFTISLRSSHSLMQRAIAGAVASGTATLEAAFFGMPLVIVYKVAWLTWIVGRRLVRVEFLGMPNILAGQRIVPELLQKGASPAAVGRALLDLIRSPAARLEQQRRLAEVIARLGEPGAAGRAADAICEALR